MTSSPRFLHGLRTVVFHVPELAAARDWYAGVLGFPPYFDQPFYVGFDVGGFELGLVPEEVLLEDPGLEDPGPEDPGREIPGQDIPRGGGGTAYWGVTEIEAAVARLLELGASLHEEVTDVGGGIRVAALRDPFGNLLGVIENPEFRGMDPHGPGEVERYFTRLFGPGEEGVDEAVEAATEAIRHAGMPEISISPAEGHLLHLLASLVDARRILEIGTLGGVAAIWLARALPPAPDGELVSLEVDPDHAAVARRSLEGAGLGARVDVRVGAALELLPQLEREIRAGEGAPFDMVFIDADKEPYAEYLDLAIRLTRAGGLIVADNVVRGGRILDPGTTDASVLGIRRFNEALARDPRVVRAAIQTVGARGHDGMALAMVLPRETG
jgi:predicted O-methyltransferase YrrM/catechol 2,3-dioxygenase-like lactoylglutathione lyase family enzyme